MQMMPASFQTMKAHGADDPKAWEQAAWDLQARNRHEADDEERHRDRSAEDLLSDHLKRRSSLSCDRTRPEVVQWLIDALKKSGI
jgi:hypothetical protein